MSDPIVPYLDIVELKARTIMPPADVDALDPTFVLTTLEDGTSEIESVLRKRYATPFNPVPRVVKRWLARITTPELYERRGWSPSDDQSKDILAAAERARAEMQRAADSENGLYDLPLRADGDASGVAKGGPFGTSDLSPYDWLDRQREALRGR